MVMVLHEYFVLVVVLPSYVSANMVLGSTDSSPRSTRTTTTPVTRTKSPCHDACSSFNTDLKKCINCMKRPIFAQAMRKNKVTRAPLVGWIPATKKLSVEPQVFCSKCGKSFNYAILRRCIAQCRVWSTTKSGLDVSKLPIHFMNIHTTRSTPGSTRKSKTQTAARVTTKSFPQNVDVNIGSSGRDTKHMIPSNGNTIYISIGKKIYMWIVPSVTLIVLLLAVIVILIHKKQTQHIRKIGILRTFR